MQSVLSLQRSSFLTIARQVRLFPPPLLACLPKRLRLDLLRELSAVDICRLERGPVCSDIESVDDEVWRVLCQTRLPEYIPKAIVMHLKGLDIRPMGTALKASESKAQEREQCLVLTHKEWYLCNVASCLFSTHKVAALPCLSQGPKPHMAEYATDECSDVEVLLVLMKECHFLPPVLHIACEALLSSALWQRRSETFTLLAAFLAKISRLGISSHTTRTQSTGPLFGTEALLLVLEALLLESTGEPVLTHLAVAGGNSFMLNALSVLADLFSARGGVQPLHAHSTLTTQYDQLQCLGISLWNVSELVSEPDPNTDLRMIIEHQKSLGVLQLKGWQRDRYGACSEYDQMMKSISSLFKSPQFTKLELEMAGIFYSTKDSLSLHNILLDFLSSPIQGQELVMCDICAYLGQQSSTLSLANATVARNIVGYKCIHIKNELCKMWITPLFTDYLTCYPLQSLSKLTLENVEAISDSLLEGIASLTSLKALHLCKVCLYSKVSVASLANLFAMPSLCTLRLCAFTLLYANLVPLWEERLVDAVTMGLQKQQFIAHLTTLALSANNLHKVKTASLETMFRTLFSLHQLSDLCLDLQGNKFTSSQLELFHQTWIEVTGGQRLAKLGVLEQNDNHSISEDIVSKLRKIAVQVS